MKVRLSESMVRFRLSRAEVEAVSEGKTIALSLVLQPASLSVRLEPVNTPSPTADAIEGLRIGIPSEWLRGWPQTEVVGFDFMVEPAGEKEEAMRVVVEKDFPCAHGEDGPPKPVRKP